MRSSFLDFAARKTFFLSSVLIGMIIFAGALLTAKYYTGQIAAVTAGSCYLQSEIDAKGVEKTNLENDLAATQDQITTTNKDITDNWAALTTANEQIKALTPKVLSEYEVTKVNDLYTQLNASKTIDTKQAQSQAALKSANTAKATYTTLYPQVQASYNLTYSLRNKATIARSSTNPTVRATYNSLMAQYNTALAKYNALNAKYNTAIAQYKSYNTQYSTLYIQYTTAVSQYNAKYTPAYTTTTTATLETQYTAKKKLVDASKAIEDQITKLNESITTYKTKDAELNKLVSDLALALSTLKNKIGELENTISVYKTNICPLKELICNDNIDNNRNGTQDCDDLDCKGSVACQVGGSCGDSVCSAGENHDNCPQDCEASTNSTVKYFPPYGADTDSGIEELTITFPYDINYSGGTVSIYENGVPSEVGISVSSSTSRKVTLSLANTLEPGKFYSIRANLDIGDGNMWTGGWGFRTVGGDGGGDTAIYGCTGAGADNYNPSATVDDGSCTYNGGRGGTTEICSNGTDDDNNGFSDCADPVCSTTPACQVVDCSVVSNCSNSVCANSSVCSSGGGGSGDACEAMGFWDFFKGYRIKIGPWENKEAREYPCGALAGTCKPGWTVSVPLTVDQFGLPHWECSTEIESCEAGVTKKVTVPYQCP